MNSQKIIFDQALGHLKAGNSVEAISLCTQGLQQEPGDVNIICLWARALMMAKEFNKAKEKIMMALNLAPNFATAHEVFGDLLMLEGQLEKSIAAYQHAQSLAPDSTHLAPKISRAQQLTQTKSEDPSRVSPDLAFVKELEQAQQHKKEGQPGKAEQIYRTILRKNPNHAEAMRLLADIACSHNKYDDAELLLLRAVSKSPKFSRAWLDLSKVQLDLGKYPDAVKSAEHLVELTPDNAESYVALANTQAQSNQPQLAIESYKKTLSLAPKHKGGFAGLAHQLKTIGRQEEAVEVHRQNIETNPTNAEPYWNLANLKTFRFKDSEVEAMQNLLENKELDDLSQVQLCNALGLEFEGRKDYAQAFEYFHRCNVTHRSSEKYDPVGHEVMINKIIEVFDKSFIEKHQGQGNPDISPIFIVGLPRSGSTLIEQILASHSQVEGTHELPDLAYMVKGFKKRNAKNLHFPENLQEPGQKSWTDIGADFIQRTQKYRSGTPRFIDKNPNNFVYSGLIHLMLPNAKIINARRHPLDSCFGSYKQLFASGQPFSYDLSELGEYYLQYWRIMEHWHQVIPSKVLNVDYEHVVADLDTQVKRILDYCGLPFEESCLNFHQTDRAVKTASSEQVRRPIYSSSVNLWKNYEQDLEELIEVLEPLLLERDPEDRPASLN